MEVKSFLSTINQRVSYLFIYELCPSLRNCIHSGGGLKFCGFY